jgi:hypothetical protein
MAIESFRTGIGSRQSDEGNINILDQIKKPATMSVLRGNDPEASSQYITSLLENMGASGQMFEELRQGRANRTGVNPFNMTRPEFSVSNIPTMVNRMPNVFESAMLQRQPMSNLFRRPGPMGYTGPYGFQAFSMNNPYFTM